MAEIATYVTGALAELASGSTWLWILIGTFMGIIVGAIPGFTSSMATGILLPVTFALSPVNALVFLISVYIATIYGGSITAILLNTPGAPESSASTFDGYKMTLKGQGCEALGIAFCSSACGGLISYIFMIFAMMPIARMAVKIGPTEMFLIALMGVSILAVLSSSANVPKTLLSGFVGLLIGTMGMTPTGEWRATFGSIYLAEGVQTVPAIIGFFAMSEVFSMVGKEFIVNRDAQTKTSVKKIIKGFGMALRYPKTLLTCSLTGMVIGAIPAAGGTVAAFTAYGMTKKSSKHGDEFGTGYPEGIAAPESANNACTGGALMTTLALGVPGSSTCAILLGALSIQGLTPGPTLVRDQMPLVYVLIMAAILSQGVMLAMAIGAGFGLTNLLDIPTKILAPCIMTFCIAGSFACRNAMFDVFLMFGLGIIGYLMKQFDFSLAGMVLGIVLGGIADNQLIRANQLFGSDMFKAMFTRPISLVLVLVIVFSVVWPYIAPLLKKNKAKSN